jgi:hypothetical protein
VSKPPTNGSVTWDQVRAWRLAHHFLIGRAPKKSLLKVVRSTCGVHAQVQSSAELQIWARVRGVAVDDVRRALWDERTLVRTWSLRGTLHLHAADDLPIFVAALREHDRWWKGSWLRMIGMTETELRSVLAAIRTSLGARPLTREQLADKVAQRVGPTGRDRMMSGWGEMLKPASFQGFLCSGPPRGQSVTFVRPDRWLAAWKPPAPDDAWTEIVRRYLRAYGPADREEFGRWWGMQPAPAGRVLTAAAERVGLSAVTVEGHARWFPTEDLGGLQKSQPSGGVRLLPAFDVYVVGTRPRSALVDPQHEAKVFRRAGWISPVVLIDGRASGIWRHQRNGSGLAVEVQPFGKPAARHREAIEDEARRLGRFLDAPAVVNWT